MGGVLPWLPVSADWLLPSCISEGNTRSHPVPQSSWDRIGWVRNTHVCHPCLHSVSTYSQQRGGQRGSQVVIPVTRAECNLSIVLVNPLKHSIVPCFWFCLQIEITKGLNWYFWQNQGGLRIRTAEISHRYFRCDMISHYIDTCHDIHHLHLSLLDKPVIFGTQC